MVYFKRKTYNKFLFQHKNVLNCVFLHLKCLFQITSTVLNSIILLHWQYYQNFIISNTNFYCLFGRFFFLLSILRPFFTDLLPLLFWKKVENLIELVWGGCLPKQESRYCISTKGTRLVNFIVLLQYTIYCCDSTKGVKWRCFTFYFTR